MPTTLRTVLLALACALVLAPAAARGEVVESPVSLAAAANGVVGGTDGNVYVVESANASVLVLTPSGAFVRRVALPGPAGAATSAAVGPDGRVWVAIGGTGPDRGFARIDAAGVQTPQSTAVLFPCGPIGMAVGSSVRMLFSAPAASQGACAANHGLGGVDATGSNAAAYPGGESFDLATFAGKLFVPDFGGDTITRRGYGPSAIGAAEATVGVPTGSGPDGIEVGPGNQLYVTLFTTGQVVRVDPAQNGGSAQIVASGLVDPFGLATGSDGALYVASQDARVLRIDPDGSQRSIALPAGFTPWQLAAVGNDIWVTSNTTAQAVRIRNAGRPEPAPPTPSGSTPPPATASPIPLAIPRPPKVDDVVSLAATKRCLSRRRLTLTVRKPKAGNAKVSSVKVTVGRGKPKTYAAKRLKVPVTLAGLPKGTFKVKLEIRLADGTKVTGTRTYRICARKRGR